MSYNTNTNSPIDTMVLNERTNNLDTAMSGKQETLVSGQNIKTINGESILGTGNMTIESSSEMIFMDYYNWGDGPWSGLPSGFTAILNDTFSEDSATSISAIQKLFNSYTVYNGGGDNIFEYLHATYVGLEDYSENPEDPTKFVNVYFGASWPELSNLLGIVFIFDLNNQTIACTLTTNN